MTQNLLFEELIQKVVVRLSQVPGTSVQTYAEDRIGDMIQHKFDVLFDEKFWEQFMYWQAVSLDGTTGVPTVDLTMLTNPLKRFQDIRLMKVQDTDITVKRLPSEMNPFVLTGTRPRYVEPTGQAGKIFRCWPLTSTDGVVISYRSQPDAFTVGDTVPFDAQAIILGTTYDYLEDDGTNPGAIEKFKIMFEARVRQLKLNSAELAHDLDPRMLDDSTQEWQEY